ncbi:neuropeptide FF receptor 2-like [Actinia tenebrosa]|uniref:Neuropeptide FF receptor 2-like n=1 Tax=Actinia tenebrosa TaxID=6105 RepID=A0A6P8J130_ACTTE|nr:neuropeptide FF receptor 2-like [Actinia tenebrosa]
MTGSFSKVVIPTVSSILVLTDLIGNTLVILIILTNKSMKSPINYLLFNLAVADIMVGAFVIPKAIFQYLLPHPVGIEGKIICKVFISGNFAWIGGAASVFSLMAICFERFLAVMYPYSVRLKLTFHIAKRIIMASWIFASILVSSLFVVMDYDQEKEKCIQEWPRQPSWLSKAFSLLWFTAAGFAPLAIMFVLYNRVIYSLWFKKNQVQGTQLAVLKSRKRVTKMMVTVSVVYFLTWFPTLTFYVLIEHHVHVVDIPMTDIIQVLSILVLCSSAINPFIYSLQSENFRRELRKLLCCRKTCKNRLNPLGA